MSNKKESIPFIKSLLEFAPYITRDFNDWMIKTNNRPDWKEWKSQVLIGWLLQYISQVYIMFPDLLTVGEYNKGFPLDDPNLPSSITEYERFLYNILAELVRLDNELFE